jgi:excisionase family DNA binding protein
MSSALQPIAVAPVPRLALRRAEAAAALSISDRTLDEWVKAGDVPHFRRGGCLLFPIDGLREWLAAQAGRGDAAT